MAGVMLGFWEDALGGLLGGDSSGMCSTCGCRVERQASLACGACGKSFHAETVCVGISIKSIECIMTEGNAVRYFCCSCRYNNKIGNSSPQKAENVNPDFFSQLLEMVGALAGQVRELVNKASRIDGGEAHYGRDKTSVGAALSRGHDVDKVTLQREIKEFHEREKRKASVIVRGCAANNPSEVQSTVDDICKVLSIDRVALKKVATLKTKGLFRCQIEDDERRKILLQNVKKLRNIEKYRRVYIDRDLTYQQRQELKARRENAKGGIPDAQRSGGEALETADRENCSEKWRVRSGKGAKDNVQSSGNHFLA